MYWIFVAVTFTIGMAAGWLASEIHQSRHQDDLADRYIQNRAILGLPDRDLAQRGAKGVARMHTAEYRERDPEHGMDM